ncbi:MAG TPA: DUF1667 domain-containing protein [Thermotogaceae bacterium]|nr:DUF1667 domain-containing protein [Thermotogaceae bacterium]
MDKKIICIACPIGCEINVHIEKDGKMKIQGNRCKRGESYAKDEILNPKRVLTMSIRVENGEMDLVSVKTDGSIPKKLIPKAIEYLKGVKIRAPIKVGDVIVENLLDTGVKVVATRTVLEDAILQLSNK